jgi:hypothetical protein
MSWRESVAGMDDASEYADKHKEVSCHAHPA